MFKKQQQDELRVRMVSHLQFHPSLKPGRRVPYGTAGFRGPVKEIGWIFYRAGIVAALRCFDQRVATGLMITASHNPIEDNGIKFIDANGRMMCYAWELIVEELCNIQDIDEFIKGIDKVVSEHKIYCDVKPTKAQILIGYDTRPSSEYLANIVIEGIRALAERLLPVTEYKLCTTPELHWFVGEMNKRSPQEAIVSKMRKSLYVTKLLTGIEQGFIMERPVSGPLIRYDKNSLVVDCANGVGKEIMKQMKQLLEVRLNLQLINVGEGVLNESCGADYVKTSNKPAKGADQPGKRYASLDGDADRLVYFYLHKERARTLKFRLLDGDKIMALYAKFITHIMNKSRYKNMLSVGCVQTAYANGASTDYLKGLGLPVDCTHTGVKNLHRQAMTYDVGIFFEANGHGTIHLSTRAQDLFTAETIEIGVPRDIRVKRPLEEVKANFEFHSLYSMVNIYTGDGISDLLMVEVILKYFDMSMDQWYGLYKDRPSRLIMLKVKDKSLIKTIDIDRKILSPPGLQAEIDAIVTEFGPGARAFVRPSGTENVARVYAEGNSQIEADEIATLVGRKTIEFCDNFGQ